MTHTTYTTPKSITMNPGWLKRRLAFGLPLSTALLGVIITLAAFLRFYNLSAIGDGNLYYTAAVESMSQSWHNFFFNAAEPGASVTVDKPPLGLWLQVASAALFGVNGMAVTLPQVLAGILSVPVVYLLVRRYAGELAGLVAALTLAITPVAIAVERNNTMDATLLFTLLLAAWAFVKATDTGKLRWLMLGGVLVGLAFNIKMLQAFLPLPAFYALYFLGAKTGWLRKIVNLALMTGLMLMVSFSWAIAVDLTPADQRPYVGSSENNTVMELIFGHNGLNRLLGGARNLGNAPGDDRGNLPVQGPGNADALPPQGNFGPQGQGKGPTGPPPDNLPFPPPNGQGIPGDAPGDAGQPFASPDAGPGGGNGPGQSGEIGEPGLARLFTNPLNNEIAWLLPFSLLSIALVGTGSRLSLPLSDTHQGLVLWGGWLLAAGGFFTVAAFYHAYYLIMLGPPVAAMVGMGFARMWHLRANRPALAWVLLVLSAAGTLAFQIFTAAQYESALPWAIPAVVILAAGVGLAAIALVLNKKRLGGIAAATLLVAMLVYPAAWSWLTTSNTSANAGLVSSYSGDAFQGPGGNRANVNEDLLAFLQANTQDTEYLMAVRSSMDGASYVIETGRPVLYMGGFGGNDPVVDAADLQELVADGDLRYVLWSERGGPGAGLDSSEITGWLHAACTQVDAPGLGEETGGPPGPGGRGPGGQAMLYECNA